MRRTDLALSIALTGAAGLAGVALAQMAPNAKESSAMAPSSADDRQPVPVTEATRTFVLTEMRGMLAAAQGVAEGIGNSDWKAAAAAAGKSGLKAFQGMPRQVMMELPVDFRGMGRESHMAFDAVADAANGKPNASAVSAKLADAMRFCVSCHQTYRFTAKP